MKFPLFLLQNETKDMSQLFGFYIVDSICREFSYCKLKNVKSNETLNTLEVL